MRDGSSSASALAMAASPLTKLMKSYCIMVIHIQFEMANKNVKKYVKSKHIMGKKLLIIVLIEMYT